MSSSRPPYAEDNNNAHPMPYNTRPRYSSGLPSPPTSPPSGPSFPQPTISGHDIPLFHYTTNTYGPPHTPQDLPMHSTLQRPPPQPAGFPIRTAPPGGPPHPGPAANYMQHNRMAASETRLPQSRIPAKVLPDRQNFKRLSPHELNENTALRRFQSNQLHDDDRYWHAVVPEDCQKRLSSKEQDRQKEIFGIIASEQQYVSDLELWLTVYRDPLRTQHIITPPHVLESFIKEVFSNIEEIKIQHELLLQTLFETQKRNYRQVHSIMDDLFETVSSEQYQRLYVNYISNIDMAIARHNRELAENQQYERFVSSEAAMDRDSRVRKLDFSSFLHRAERRLGQLKLQVDQVKKKTEMSHVDQSGFMIDMVLEMLHRTVMRGQAKGKGSAEQTALRMFRESLENPPWELADLCLAQAHRAVNYEGNLTQVYPLSSTPVHLVLLDNYLVFTQLYREDGSQKRMIHKPIPLEILEVELETAPLGTRVRVASLLGRQDTSQVVRFVIKRNGVFVVQLGATSKRLAEKWIEHMREAATLRTFDIEANKLLALSAQNVLSHGLRNQGELVAACTLVYQNETYTACATTTGLFIGHAGNGSSMRSILCLSAVTQLVSIPHFYDLVVLHGGTVSTISLANLLAPNQRTSALMRAATQLSDPKDGHVFAVCGGVIGGRSVVVFITRHYYVQMRKRLHLYVYDTISSQLRPYGEPTPISDSVDNISIVSGAIFLSGKTCQVIRHPLQFSGILSNWPDFSPPYVDTFGMQYLCSSGRFICSVETAPGRILLVYDTHGCFVNNAGQPISSSRKHEWAITPKAASCRGGQIALFSDGKIEVRDGLDGQLLQILSMPDADLLLPVLSHSAHENVLMAMKRAEGGHKNMLGELLPTSNVATPMI